MMTTTKKMKIERYLGAGRVKEVMTCVDLARRFDVGFKFEREWRSCAEKGDDPGPLGNGFNMLSRTCLCTDWGTHRDIAILFHELVHVILQPSWSKKSPELHNETFLLIPLEFILAKHCLGQASFKAVVDFQKETDGVRDFPVTRSWWFKWSVERLLEFGVLNSDLVPALEPIDYNRLNRKVWMSLVREFNKEEKRRKNVK